MSHLARCAVVALALVVGCEERPKIVPNPPTSGEEGTHYKVQLEMQPKKEGWSFEGCAEEDDGFVGFEGDVSLFLDKSREYYLCARTVGPAGTKGEEYRWVVKPTPRKPDPPELVARRKELEAIRAKHTVRLRRARAAVAALGEAPSACPAETEKLPPAARRLWAYPAKEVTWTRKNSEDPFTIMQVTTLTPGRSVMRPNDATPEALEAARKAAAAKHAVLVAITKDERPVVKDKGYEGGVVEAVAHVVDLEAAQVLCSAPLRYETPQAVITKYWDLGGGAAAKARAKKVMVELELARELHKSGAETLAKTLAALAPGWKLQRPAP